MNKVDFEQYKKDSMCTESTFAEVKVQKVAFKSMLRAAIAVGNIADMFKKNMAYGKAFNYDRMESLVSSATDQIRMVHAATCEGARDNLSVIDVNPRILHAVLGKFTESVEMLEAIERSVFGGATLDMVNMGEELGDDMWYTALLCDAGNLDLASVMATNTAKLKARYPDKYTHDSAINRDLTTERAILEGAQ